jgi:peptide/nickel transport system substrate-binding protein
LAPYIQTLAERVIAAKRAAMRRLLALLLILCVGLVPAACRKQPQGTLKVVVVGAEPQLRDPASGPLTTADSVLLANVAQGLVRFDSAGNIVPGLAERWNVSDDGLSYIFRIASATPGGRKITAEQVARLLKRAIGAHSKDSLKDSFGAVDDIVPMTDRVIEISLKAPRPELLSLLAQPDMAILHGGSGTGPFTASRTGPGGPLRLSREIVSPDDETTEREEVLLGAMPAADAVRGFAAAETDLVLGGTFADLAFAQRVKLPRGSLRFDPASGLFGLVPVAAGGPLDKPEIRQLLSQAIDRDALVGALGVAGLTPRATLLEPGLDGVLPPVPPVWMATAFTDRLPSLQAQSARLFGNATKPTIRVALPQGPGADLLFQLLARDWGALGLTVQRAPDPAAADFVLVDKVAPSSSAAWFVRQFRCGAAAVCDDQADQLMQAARDTPVPAQRYALLAQAAARIDDQQLFIPITAPVRWALVSRRIEGFAGNRYARHTLTDLQEANGDGE